MSHKSSEKNQHVGSSVLILLIRHISQLEQIQRFPLKVCFKQWNARSYSAGSFSYSAYPVLQNAENSLACVINDINFQSCPLMPRTLI